MVYWARKIAASPATPSAVYKDMVVGSINAPATCASTSQAEAADEHRSVEGHRRRVNPPLG